MARGPTLIVLDRDGVLNQTIPNPAEPRPDSPLHPGEASVFPWVPDALRALGAAGFGLVIATNQPAAAKGKTTRAALEEVHAAIVLQAEAAGATILSSHICFHRAEDGCACRKPATGLLAEAFARHPSYAPGDAWMVGDRASADHAELEARAIRPSFCGVDLRDFTEFLLRLT